MTNKKQNRKKIRIEIPNLSRMELQILIKSHLLDYTIKFAKAMENNIIPLHEPRYLLAFIHNWVEDRFMITEE